MDAALAADSGLRTGEVLSTSLELGDRSDVLANRVRQQARVAAGSGSARRAVPLHADPKRLGAALLIGCPGRVGDRRVQPSRCTSGGAGRDPQGARPRRHSGAGRGQHAQRGRPRRRSGPSGPARRRRRAPPPASKSWPARSNSSTTSRTPRRCSSGPRLTSGPRSPQRPRPARQQPPGWTAPSPCSRCWASPTRTAPRRPPLSSIGHRSTWPVCATKSSTPWRSGSPRLPKPNAWATPSWRPRWNGPTRPSRARDREAAGAALAEAADLQRSALAEVEAAESRAELAGEVGAAANDVNRGPPGPRRQPGRGGRRWGPRGPAGNRRHQRSQQREQR